MTNLQSSVFSVQSKGMVLAIVGPTGAGKTAIAQDLARRLGGEIVSADSMQVYREMDIGTAKATKADRRALPHHLLDIASLDRAFSVAEYQTLARRAIAEIQARGRLPVLVGGSGLYVRSVIDDLVFPPHDEDAVGVRERFYQRVEAGGRERLVQALEQSDPESARRIEPGNVRRIVRALEVNELTGRPFSAYQRHWTDRVSVYQDLVMVGITLERFALYRRLETRVDEMLERGLLGEVRALAEAGYRQSLTARQAIGYKELVAFLDGRVSYDDAVARIKRNTRRLAKRQLTWFRADPRVMWFEVGEGEPARRAAHRVESHIRLKTEGVRLKNRAGGNCRGA